MYNRNYDTPIAAPKRFSSQTSSGLSSLSDEDITVNEHLVRSGSALHGYKGVIKAGGNATTSYTLDATRLRLAKSSGITVMRTPESSPGAGDYVDTHYFSGVALPIDVISHFPPDTSGLEAAALAKIYQKLRSERSATNGFIFVGELRETIHMLRHPLAALHENLGRVVLTEKRKIGELRSLRSAVKRRDAFAKMVSGTVLEINFGWRPFVSDILDIGKGVERLILQPRKRDRIRSVSEAELVTQFDSQGISFGGNWGYQFRGNLTDRYTTTSSVKYTVGLETSAAVASSAIERLRTEFGFTAENWLPAVYELVPWSFLLDYFTNVGTIIEAGTTATADVKWICKSSKTRTQLIRSSIGIEPFKRNLADPASRYVSSWTGVDSTTSGIRTTLSRAAGELTIPPLKFKNPFLSAQKFVNMLALMEQQRRSVRF